MKKYFFLLICLLCSNCAGMCFVNAEDTKEAKRMYDSYGTYLAQISEQEKKDLFGECYDPRTDRIFIYSTLYSKKYILERVGEPFTYAGSRW